MNRKIIDNFRYQFVTVWDVSLFNNKKFRKWGDQIYQKMMKYILSFWASIFVGVLFGQIEQIQTGYTQGIGFVSETDSAKYFVSADQGIIRYSKTADNIDLLPVPHYSNGYNAGIQIFGDSLWYMSTIYPGYPYPFTLSKSTDKGETWNVILDTICDKDLAGILVLDTSRIYLLGTAQPSLKTANGGVTWMETSDVSDGHKYLRYNDTIGFYAAGDGFSFTLDNGETWTFDSITGELVIEEPAGIYFVQLKQADGTSVCKLVLE